MKKKETCIWLILSIAVFTGMYAVIGLQLGGDYGQYVDMHINREPLYPLYLAFFRKFFGAGYLNAAVFVQGILMAAAAACFLKGVSDIFQLSVSCRIWIFGLLIAPHMITPVFSKSHLVITNGIMSEALAIPVHLLFILALLKEIYCGEEENGEHKVLKRQALYGRYAFLLSFLLSLIRGQMMPTVLVWFLVNLVLAILKKRGKPLVQRCVLLCLMLILFFGGRTLLVKTYNYAVHGYFINNTYGNVNFAAQVLLVSEPQDISYIQDERAKEMFLRLNDFMEEKKANNRYMTGMNPVERAYYIEDKHDTLKFDGIETLTREYLRSLGIRGDERYIEQNVEIDRIAGEITKAVLPHHLGSWLLNYFSISINGLVRSIAYDKSIFMWYAFVMYLLSVLGMVHLYRKNPKAKSIYFMALSLLSIFANVYATSMTIMCLSRYMIYGFSIFYLAFFLMLREHPYKNVFQIPEIK